MSIVLDVPAQDPIAAAEDRAALIEGQAALLAVFDRYCLGLDADVAMLSVAIAYLAHAHGVDPHALAFRAVAPSRGDRGLH